MAENKEITKKIIRNKVIVISLLSVLFIFSVFLATYKLFQKQSSQNEISLVLTSSTGDSIYVGGEGEIFALLVTDGEDEQLQGTFLYESDSEMLQFINETGKFRVNDVILDGFDYNDSVSITVTCNINDIHLTQVISLRITEAIPHKITFVYPDKNDVISSVIGEDYVIYEGYCLNEIPTPSFGVHQYKWIVDGSNEEYNPLTDKYYWHGDIVLSAKFEETSIIFRDELNNTTDSQSTKVIYGETINTDLWNRPLDKDGWHFVGWFPDISSDELENGVKEHKFCLLTNELVAKWEAKPIIDPLFNTKDAIPSNISVVYNMEIQGLMNPNYLNDGIFIEWVTSDNDGMEISIHNGSMYPLGTNMKIYAKIKFPIEFNYEGTTENVENEKKQYYIIYNESLSSQNISLPQPLYLQENGWKFDGWYTDIGGAGKQWTSDSKYVEKIKDNESGKLRLYAKRISSITYHRLLDINGEATNETITVPIVYRQNINIISEENILSDEKIVWKFDGYYNVPNGVFQLNDTENEKIDSLKSYTGKGEINLFARWSSFIHFTVDLAKYADPTKPLGSTQSDLSVIYNGELPILPKVNYTISNDDTYFEGWFTEEYGFGKQIQQGELYKGYGEQTYHSRTRMTIYFNDPLHQVYERRDFIYGKSLEECKNIVENATIPNFEEKGWKHTGWSVKDLGDIEIEDFLNLPYSFITPYLFDANWEITIFYDTDLGSIQNVYGNMNKYDTYRYGQMLRLKRPGKQGSWEFANWYTELYGKGICLEDISTSSEEFINIVKSNSELIEGVYCVRIYAKWVSRTLLNYGNGYEPNENLAKQLEFIYGQAQAQLPSNEEISDRDGYSKGNWYNNSDFSGDSITKNTTIFPLDFSTIYYEWIGGTCMVYLDYIGETGTRYQVAYLNNVIRGNDMPEISNDILPKKDIPKNAGVFLGYYCEENNNIYYNYNEEVGFTSARIFDIVGSEVHLIGKWGVSYSVLLDSNGGSGGTTSINVVYEQEMPSNAKIVSPTRYGYTFKGYYDNKTDLTDEHMYYNAEMKSTQNWNRASGGTLYAKWSANQYRITFDSNGGNSPSFTNNDYIFGKPFGILPTVTKSSTSRKTFFTTIVTSYEFVGWYTDDETKITNNSVLSLAGNQTFYAHWKSSDSECVTAGTLVTLADGTQLPVEQLKGNEELMVWNIYTGRIDKAPILFVDSDPEAEYEIVNLIFSDGTITKVVTEHGFWDYDLNEWVYLNKNASQYIGHYFNKQSFDIEGKVYNEKVQLKNVIITNEITTTWSPITYSHFCYYVNGMLSLPGGITGFFNIFEVDKQMKIDETKMLEDIENYGLFTYDDFKDLIPETVFKAFNGQYLRVSMSKGLITWNDILLLVDKYGSYWETN
ncbi:MAG: InlB B-repeat-containing protein [Anaeroplasma bactoclasticum]|nr:InlB B-repeat-containing protein [Anaeroplasma bactoclasticum]MCM1195656.1 InlB B-repeat-containing protein [Roseburia sp.]MCM1514772.1 InlB B-repeat-containing protein [Anaeroplasma bactoclasticum]MCM1556113.1 InlB B-repeat-containing protein [Anaeroplasma bactoclasticum]